MSEDKKETPNVLGAIIMIGFVAVVAFSMYVLFK